jgi:hypothetical protein
MKGQAVPGELDRPPEFEMPPQNLAARRRVLGDHVRRSAASGSTSRWHRFSRLTRIAVIGLFGVVLLGGTAAWAYVAFAPAKVPVADETRCYSVASLDVPKDKDFYGTSVTTGAPFGGHASVKAIEACTPSWQLGILTEGSTTIARPQRGVNRPVPHLVACVLPEGGVAAVFPGPDDTCQKLGLPRLAE